MFSERDQSIEPGKCFESSVHSVFRFATPANIGKSLLAGNKDHVLNEARSELMKQEHQVESPNSCIDELQKQAYAQRLELENAHHGHIESRKEQSRLQEELSMKEKPLRETQIRSMHEMGEMKRAQELRVDELSALKLRESHQTIHKCREKQEQMMIYEVESNHSGRLSHVPSQPPAIPSSRSMLGRDKRLPLDTWNMSGPQENVFGNQFSTFIRPKIIIKDHCTTPPGATGSVPLHICTGILVARDEDRIKGTFPMPTFASRPSTMRFFSLVAIPQLQRQQIFELQYDKFPAPSSFLYWKTRFKNQVTTCSDCPSGAVLWVTEEGVVDSLDELKSPRSIAGDNFPNFEMLDARIASSLKNIIQNSTSSKILTSRRRPICQQRRKVKDQNKIEI